MRVGTIINYLTLLHALATEPEKSKTRRNRPVQIILGIGVLITLLSIQVPWLSIEIDLDDGPLMYPRVISRVRRSLIFLTL